MKKIIVCFAKSGREAYHLSAARMLSSLMSCGYDGDVLVVCPELKFEEATFYYQNGKEISAEFPEHSELPYAFKPFLIDHVRQLGYTNVCWFDSTIFVHNSNIDKIFLASSEFGIAAKDNENYPLSNWISDKAVELLNITSLELVPQIMACWISFDFRKELAVSVLKEWKEYCLNKDIISETGSKRQGYKSHRHDQAILSWLLYKNKVPLIKDCEIFSYWASRNFNTVITNRGIGEGEMNEQTKQRLQVIGRSAYSTFPMIEKSFEFAEYCIQNNIEGDFVECGVAAGAQVGAMALALQANASVRNIHLFDSFEGIPLAGKYDVLQPGIGLITHDTNVPEESLLVSSGISAHSLDAVKNNMRAWGFGNLPLFYHKGWFQNTVPVNNLDKIAILRLDGDLYESTKVCLEHLVHKVVKGGFVIIDDYALPGAYKAVNDFIKDKNIELIRMPYGIVIGNNPPGYGVTPEAITPVYWQVS